MKRALVLLGAGIDSTACVLWALRTNFKVQTLTFNYGQSNVIEVKKAAAIARALDLEGHTEVDISKSLPAVAQSSMLQSPDKIGTIRGDGLPTTYVPGRNYIFLAYATALAEGHKCDTIITGNQQLGNQSSPDNRDVFMKAVNVASNLAVNRDFQFVNPFMFIEKKDILREFTSRPDILAMTYTCYRGTEPSCGTCAVCKRRLESFRIANIEDPIPYEVRD